MNYTFKLGPELAWAVLVAVIGALAAVMPVEMPHDMKAFLVVAVTAVVRAIGGLLIAGVAK